MPTFSETSKKRLAECHVDLQVLFNEVIKGYDCSIVCGHRGKADQEKAVAGGFSKTPFPASKHNKVPAMAVDAVPWPTIYKDVKAQHDLAREVMLIAFTLLKSGHISHKVRWGGDWNMNGSTIDEKFVDMPHFELML